MDELKDLNFHFTPDIDVPDFTVFACSEGSPRVQASTKYRLPTLPDYFHPDVFQQYVQAGKERAIDATSTAIFTPLMPQHMARTLVQNSFANIMAEHALLTQPAFLSLLDAQYAASSSGPAKNPARWALVNAILALALRSKIAAGAEAMLTPFAHNAYRNATPVIAELVLEDCGLIGIQALLAMAMFTRGIPDIRSFIMLSTIASRQLDLVRCRELLPERGIETEQADEYKQLDQIAKQFEYMINPTPR